MRQPAAHQAAGSLRMAQYVHFQAAQACPPELDRLLLGILGLAGELGVLGVALTDPDFAQLGPGHIGGLLAWAFLLRRTDPYRLSAPQLVVANRALRRWRELCEFQAAPASRVDIVELAPLFPEPLPDGIPGTLEIHRLRRKIRQRLAALESEPRRGRLSSGANCRRPHASACCTSSTRHFVRPGRRPPRSTANWNWFSAATTLMRSSPAAN
jgi:hypothetical protein